MGVESIKYNCRIQSTAECYFFAFFKNVKIISFYAIIFTKNDILTAKNVKRMTKNAIIFTKMHK